MNDLLAGFLWALMLKLTLWSMQHMTSIYGYCLTGDSRWNICCNLFYLPCPSVRAYSITICHGSKSASSISSSFPNYLMSFNLFLRKYIWHSSRLFSILSQFAFKCADGMEIGFFKSSFLLTLHPPDRLQIQQDHVLGSSVPFQPHCFTTTLKATCFEFHIQPLM